MTTSNDILVACSLLRDAAELLDCYSNPAKTTNATTHTQAQATVRDIRQFLRAEPGTIIPLTAEDVAVHSVTKLPTSEDQSRVLVDALPIEPEPQATAEMRRAAYEAVMSKTVVRADNTQHVTAEAFANEVGNLWTAINTLKTLTESQMAALTKRVEDVDGRISQIDEDVTAHASRLKQLERNAQDYVDEDQIEEMLSDYVKKDDDLFDKVEQLDRMTTSRFNDLPNYADIDELRGWIRSFDDWRTKLQAILRSV